MNSEPEYPVCSSSVHSLLLLILLSLMATSVSGADSKQARDASKKTGIPGETSLMQAVSAGDVRRVSLLLEQGIDVNQRNAGGVTALMMAASNGRVDLVEQLLAAGARPDINDYQGASAADRASQSGHEQLAQLLKARISTMDTGKQVGGYDFADDAFVDVTHPAWFKQSFLDLPADLDEARQNGKQGIMLFMSTRRCSYCKVFLDTVLAVPEIRQRLQANYDVIGLEILSDIEMVDVDGVSYQVSEFVTRVKANFTPTLIFYGADGQRLLRIVGYYPRDKFERVLDYLDGQHYLNEPLRDYLSRAESSTPGSRSAMIVDQELFEQAPYILDRRAAKAQQPLLVVFERGHCDACERLHRRVLSDNSIRNLVNQFEAVQLNISDNSERILTPAGERITSNEWYQRLNLSYSPAIVFFDEAGQEVMRLDSETLRYRMEGALQLVLEKAYEQDAQLQRWRRVKAIETLRKQQ